MLIADTSNALCVIKLLNHTIACVCMSVRARYFSLFRWKICTSFIHTKCHTNNSVTLSSFCYVVHLKQQHCVNFQQNLYVKPIQYEPTYLYDGIWIIKRIKYIIHLKYCLISWTNRKCLLNVHNVFKMRQCQVSSVKI